MSSAALLYPSFYEVMDVWSWGPDTSANFNNPSSAPEERKWFLIPYSPLEPLIISFSFVFHPCRPALTQKLANLV